MVNVIPWCMSPHRYNFFIEYTHCVRMRTLCPALFRPTPTMSSSCAMPSISPRCSYPHTRDWTGDWTARSPLEPSATLQNPRTRWNSNSSMSLSAAKARVALRASRPRASHRHRHKPRHTISRWTTSHYNISLMSSQKPRKRAARYMHVVFCVM